MKRKMQGLALLWAFMLCVLPQAAVAAQVSSSMGVGLIIEPSNISSDDRSVRRLFVSTVVTRAAPAISHTWNAAAISVKRAGFTHPRRLERIVALYWFEAKRREASFRIAVSIASGKIVKIVRL